MSGACDIGGDDGGVFRRARVRHPLAADRRRRAAHCDRLRAAGNHVHRLRLAVEGGHMKTGADAAQMNGGGGRLHHAIARGFHNIAFAKSAADFRGARTPPDWPAITTGVCIRKNAAAPPYAGRWRNGARFAPPPDYRA